ncbi:MAG: anion transporter [Deltaproteobacteria bacterium]|nr:anion transporter [Deltaproteobacteria bacterium]MBI3390704.1 anion transporter [Deltaproteobacteria bacterium]
MTVALIIFAATYLVLVIGELPGFRVYRTSAAFIGAVCMVGSGALPADRLLTAIDFPTLVLLFSMMIVAACLRLSGAFRLVADLVLRRAAGPYQLLAVVVLLAGVLSACFVNDVVCIVLAPLLLDVLRALERKPVPYLIALATAANIGSVATITGNPQNMIIGSLSGIPYRSFAGALWLPALVGLAIAYGLIALMFRRDLTTGVPASPPRRSIVRVHRWLALKNGAITVLLLGTLIAGAPIAFSSAAAAAWMLFTRRVKPAKVFALIDWELLVLFAGLFVVVGGLEHGGLDAWLRVQLQSSPALVSDVWFTAASVALSNVVSNVPAVLLLKRVVPMFPNATHAWLLLALSSTLAGNLTIPGSVANLIVIEAARRRGVEIRPLTYMLVGVPLTVFTLMVGMLLLGTP